MFPVQGGSPGEALVADGPAGLGDLAEVAQEALVVVGVTDGVREAAAGQGGLGGAHHLAGGVVEPQVTLLEVEDGHGHGRLLEGLGGQGGAGRAGGDDVAGGRPVGAGDRAGRDGQLDPVAGPVPQGDDARAGGEGGGGGGLRQQLRRRPAHDVRGPVPGERSRALAPPGHRAPCVEERHGDGRIHMPQHVPIAPVHQAAGGRLSPAGRGGRRGPGRRACSCAARCGRPPGRCGPLRSRR